MYDIKFFISVGKEIDYLEVATSRRVVPEKIRSFSAIIYKNIEYNMHFKKIINLNNE